MTTKIQNKIQKTNFTVERSLRRASGEVISPPLDGKFNGEAKMITRREIIELTGEDPADLFGADWQNIVAEVNELENAQPDAEWRKK